MEIKYNPKNNLKEKIKLIPQTYKRKKFAKSKLNNFTANILSNFLFFEDKYSIHLYQKQIILQKKK